MSILSNASIIIPRTYLDNNFIMAKFYAIRFDFYNYDY